jgi:hypothetical protein
VTSVCSCASLQPYTPGRGREGKQDARAQGCQVEAVTKSGGVVDRSKSDGANAKLTSVPSGR